VIVINVPPLRERRADIPVLIERFLQSACARAGRSTTLSESALDALAGYDWPGNVRELENTVERLVLFNRGATIDVDDLPPAISKSSAGAEMHQRVFADLPSLDELQRRYLVHVLHAVGGNRTRAAEVLGIDRRTLYRMAERYGMKMDES
jgi:DNA-binding NtrC family response regulator